MTAGLGYIADIHHIHSPVQYMYCTLQYILYSILKKQQEVIGLLEWRPSLLCGFQWWRSIVYVHLDSSSNSSWHWQKLAAEQLLKGQSVWTIYHSTNHTCRATLLQLSWAGRRIESALYDLRPLWSKYITPHVQLILLYKFSPLNLLSLPLVFGNLSFFIYLLLLNFFDIFDQNANSNSALTFSLIFQSFHSFS